MIDKLISKFNDNDEDKEEENELNNEDQDEEKYEDQDGLPDKDNTHIDLISPSIFIEKPDYVQSGKDYVSTLFILNWPDYPDLLHLQSILYGLPVQTEISIHISPRDKDKAIQELESKLEKAKAQAGHGVKVSTQQANQKRLEDTQEVYNALLGSNYNLHEIGMYISIRSDNKEDLKQSIDELTRELRTNSLYPELLRKNQKPGMKTVSPNGKDYINYKKSAVSGAVGALYPFNTTTIIENGGVDLGIHAFNDSPVVIDRFNRENGYNQITAGKIGSGKTYGTLLEILRYKAAYDDDLIIFLLDPLKGFKPVANMLNAKKVLVGGDTKLNPMKITSTPEEVVKNEPDIDPYGQVKDTVMDFFDMYFNMQDRDLGDSRDVLEMAVDETYRRAGIQKDISTHSNKSPTISDLLKVLREISIDGTTIAKNTESEQLIESLENHASRLVLALDPFDEGGRYYNLSQDTEFDFKNEETVYFDLSQKEGSGEVGLMMQLLLSEVYDKAKESDKKILFCIDEAHYIMKDARSLDYLEQIVRHSRHYDLGINFITQTLEEFFAHEQSEAIAQQCSLKRLHLIESDLNNQIKNTLDLTDSHVKFINQAQAGSKELGYSEALVGVDEYGYVPTRIYPSEFEIQSIDAAEEL